MKKQTLILVATLLLIYIGFSCDSNKSIKLKPLEKDTILTYINEGKSPKPVVFNVMTLLMKIKNNKDSLLMSYVDSPIIVEKDSTWNTNDNFFNVINRLGASDSVHVTLPALKAFNGQVPPQMQGDDTIKMEIKVLKLYKNRIAYFNEKWDKEMKDILEKNADIIASQEKLIEDWLTSKGLKAEKTSYGVYYIIEEKGDNSEEGSIKPFDITKIHYTLRNMEGKVIDSSDVEVAKSEGTYTEGRPYDPFPVTVGLTKVIKGWHEGLQYFHKNAKGKLIIPSYFAYGKRGYPPDIPADTPLIFDIQIADLTHSEIRKYDNQ